MNERYEFLESGGRLFRLDKETGVTFVLVIKAGFDRLDNATTTYEYLPVPEPETADEPEEEDTDDEAA